MTRTTAGTIGMESGGRMAMAGTRGDTQRIKKRKARHDQSAGRQTLVETLTGTSWTHVAGLLRLPHVYTSLIVLSNCGNFFSVL